MGVTCSLSFTAILLETYITPKVYDVVNYHEHNDEFEVAAGIGFGFCIFSLLISIILVNVDFLAEK